MSGPVAQRGAGGDDVGNVPHIARRRSSGRAAGCGAYLRHAIDGRTRKVQQIQKLTSVVVTGVAAVSYGDPAQSLTSVVVTGVATVSCGGAE